MADYATDTVGRSCLAELVLAGMQASKKAALRRKNRRER